MARMADRLDPMTLIPAFPSQTEEKRYDLETEVRVPLARAAAIKGIQLRRWLQWVGIVVGATAGVVVGAVNAWFEVWLWVYAGVGLVFASGIVYVWQRAEWDTDQLIIDAFRRDIVDPLRDSERRSLLDTVLAWHERQQKQPAPDLQPILLSNNGQTETIEREPKREYTQAEHLLAFMRAAKDLGWSRRRWCPENGPRTTLTTGLRVQRKEWRHYTEMACRFGFAAEKPDGSLDWSGDADEIIARYHDRLYVPWQPAEPCP